MYSDPDGSSKTSAEKPEMSVSGLLLACCFVPEVKATEIVFSKGTAMFRLSLKSIFHL